MDEVRRTATDRAAEADGTTGPMPQQLAGPVPVFDLVAEARRLRDEAGAQGGQSGRATRTLVKVPDLRLVLIALRSGARLEEHHAPGPIAIHTLAGRLRVGVRGQPVEVPAGQVLTLERGLPHDVEALEDSAFLLTIAPASQQSPPTGVR